MFFVIKSGVAALCEPKVGERGKRDGVRLSLTSTEGMQVYSMSLMNGKA